MIFLFMSTHNLSCSSILNSGGFPGFVSQSEFGKLTSNFEPFFGLKEIKMTPLYYHPQSYITFIYSKFRRILWVYVTQSKFDK